VVQPHDLDVEAFKVVMALENNYFNDGFEDLDDFCHKYHLPYPNLSL
jgi:hypothetical protein